MKKLKLEDVRPKLSFDINYGMADIELRPNRLTDVDFDFNVWLSTKNMNLQRDLVWTHFQKKQLVYSIFKNIKLPPISVLKHYKTIEDWQKRDYIYQVIDGKQRLTTILDFINNKFSVDWNEKQYFFDDLHSYVQSDFYHCITSNIGFDYPDKRISDDDKIRWFEMINFAGTPQDNIHLQNLKK